MNSFAYLVMEFALFSKGSGGVFKGGLHIIRFLFQEKYPDNSKKRELELRLLQ